MITDIQLIYQKASGYFFNQMHFVYILSSQFRPDKTYVGVTSDLQKRLTQHNEGMSHYSSKWRPWKLECFIGFSNRTSAERFEKYLKHGSGFAFMKKHLLVK